jgi:lysophospholipase L1-like esterase
VGGNDVARNAGTLDATAYKDNVRAMVDLARAHNITLVLGTILPAKQFYWRKEIEPVGEIRTLNGWLAEFAARNRIRLVDYYAPLATPEGAMRAEFSDDGVHPNRTGYGVMRQALDSALTEALADPGQAKRNACKAPRELP